jgi:hypothetical protein
MQSRFADMMKDFSERHEEVFHGRRLAVTNETHALLTENYPELDLHGEYREYDSWLWANPRRHPKNIRRGLVNWLQKSKRAALREVSRQDLVARELRVGGGPR